MGRVDSCVSLLRSFREVLREDLGEDIAALKGRAYARHSLGTIATALEELDSRKHTEIDINAVINRWDAKIGETTMIKETNFQTDYALECARICHTEAEIADNRIMRSSLISIGMILVIFAEWLSVHPPAEGAK